MEEMVFASGGVSVELKIICIVLHFKDYRPDNEK